MRALDDNPAVVLLGPRQIGKTTLALGDFGANVVYLDLQDERDRAQIADAAQYFEYMRDSLIILDEVHRRPDLFGVIRGTIDRDRRRGRDVGRFLLLGSAALDLLRQSGETLAGRVSYLELGPFEPQEIPDADLLTLWIRGGFPRSFLARDDAASMRWRRDFIRTYLERDIPELGPRIPSETLRRLWEMLAHNHGGLLNQAKLAASLAVSVHTVARYIDLLVDLFLVRRLQPWHANAGKRLVRTPKTYIRDAGILHALLDLRKFEAVLSHPVVGTSWEGFVIEAIVAAAGADATPYFYRTIGGAEIDLLLQWPGGVMWSFEIQRSSSPTLSKGCHVAIEDLQPTRSVLVHSGEKTFQIGRIDALTVHDAVHEVRARRRE